MIKDYLYQNPYTNKTEVSNPVPPMKIEAFTSRAKALFEKLAEIGSSTQEGQHFLSQLQTFGKNDLEDAVTFVEKDIGLTDAASRRLISELSNVQPIFDSALLRIKRETGYFGYSQGEQVSLSLLSRLKGSNFKEHIIFLSPDSWFFRMRMAGASYVPSVPDVIFASNDLPTDSEMLAALTTSGSLPDLASFIDHELVHKKQLSLADRVTITGMTLTLLGSILNSVGNESVVAHVLGYSLAFGAGLVIKKIFGNQFLGEVHAQIAGVDTPFADPLLSRPDRIIGMLRYYNTFKGLDSAVHAYNQIRALRLLGVSDEEIGEVVKKDKLDTNHKLSYPGLHAALEKRLEVLGIEVKYLEVLINCIFVKHQLQIITQRNLAKIIATQELKREIGDINWQSGKEWLTRFGKSQKN